MVEGVVAGVAFFTVFGMDIFTNLEAQLRLHHRQPIPVAWRADLTIEGLDSLQDVIAAVRRLNDDSDPVVRALLSVGRDDSVASAVLTVGLIPLTICRCRGRRALVDELVGELALVIGEIRERGVPATDRRLASLLVDRAWDRVRSRGRRSSRVIPVDPAEVQFPDDTSWGDPARVAVNRVVLEAVRADLVRSASERRPVIDAWNSAVVLSDRPSRTASERDRWKYVRRQLRRQFPPDLAA
ncbi:MAG: hypothetical protein JWL72_4001 [Ilumatobacteraceae bacterium]|nr:hypothetical protein [Ilumatobacteraceae bacterium]